MITDARTGSEESVVVDVSPKAVHTRQMMKEMILALFLNVLSQKLNPSAKQTLLVNVLKERHRVDEARYDFIGGVASILNGTVSDEGNIKMAFGVSH